MTDGAQVVRDKPAGLSLIGDRQFAVQRAFHFSLCTSALERVNQNEHHGMVKRLPTVVQISARDQLRALACAEHQYGLDAWPIAAMTV